MWITGEQEEKSLKCDADRVKRSFELRNTEFFASSMPHEFCKPRLSHSETSDNKLHVVNSGISRQYHRHVAEFEDSKNTIRNLMSVRLSCGDWDQED